MDPLFDRLGNLLKSLFQDDDVGSASARTRGTEWADPDLKAAWEELDDYLRADEDEARTSHAQSARRPQRPAEPQKPRIPEELRQDYGNLEVSFGANMDEVRKSYKRLILQYHPDRHVGDPKRLKYATEIAQKINQSYQRIKKYDETGRL